MHFNIINTSLNIRNLWEYMCVKSISSVESRVIWEMAGEPKTGQQEELEKFLINFAEAAFENINKFSAHDRNTKLNLANAYQIKNEAID